MPRHHRRCRQCEDDERSSLLGFASCFVSSMSRLMLIFGSAKQSLHPVPYRWIFSTHAMTGYCASPMPPRRVLPRVFSSSAKFVDFRHKNILTPAHFFIVASTCTVFSIEINSLISAYQVRNVRAFAVEFISDTIRPSPPLLFSEV